MTLVEQFRSARRVSTPLLGITSPDPLALQAQLTEILNGKAAAMTWDLLRGVRGLNRAGQDAVDALLNGQDPEAMTARPSDALRLAASFPEGACLFMLNAHRYLDDEGTSQGLLNLRDEFKSNFRTVVLLAPVLRLPVELEQDVIVFDEPLPDDAQLGRLVVELHEAAGLAAIDPTLLDTAIAALRGLSSFAAEQVTALSLRKEGLDLEALWERKRAVINATDGLKVDAGEDLAAAGGLSEILAFVDGLALGDYAPLVVVRIDEIDKAMAGTGAQGGPGDSSGTSQDAHGVILQAMEDNDWPGMLAVGAPGTGKTLISRQIGSRLGAMTISLDLGGLKGSLVGESERKIRTAMKVIYALGGRRRVLFLATCNRLDSLTPELRRRFQRRGMWFFQLPSAEERTAIWRVQMERYALTNERKVTRDGMPQDEGWTGAEIRNCCELAAARKCSLVEAARYVVPVSQSDPEMIERLSRMANGRFLSASTPGVYRMERPMAASGRKIEV